MTVAQLIAELSELPQDLPVATMGCDCVGPCDGAEVDTGWWANLGEPYVLLGRDDDAEMFPKEGS